MGTSKEERGMLVAFERFGATSDRTLDALENVLDAIWARARPIVGTTLLHAVFASLVARCARVHPWLQAIDVTHGGPTLSRIDAGTIAHDEAIAGATMLVAQILALLGTLTAGVLVDPLRREVADVLVSRRRRRPSLRRCSARISEGHLRRAS